MASVSNKVLVVLLAAFLLVACVASAQVACQVPNCNTCSATNEFQCTSCATGYIASNGQCAPPTYCGVTACRSCVSGSVSRCARCNAGYSVTASGLCSRGRRRNAAAAPAAAMWTAAVAVAVAVAYAL